MAPQLPQFVNTLTNQPTVITTAMISDQAAAAAGTVWGNPTGAAATNEATSNPVLGLNGTTGGTVTLNGSVSGGSVIQVTTSATSTATFQLPPNNGSSGNVLQTDGTGVTSWVAITSGGTVNTISVYASTQTITIPVGATKAYIKMWGATGGSGGVNSNATPGATGGTGAGGYLETYLTGLTPSATLAFTQPGGGSAGANTGGSGGTASAVTLVSGTQSISTLTCNGSSGSAGAASGSSAPPGTAGGTATGGNILNLTGQHGQNSIIDNTDANATGGQGGSTLYSIGANGVFGNSASVTGNAGNPGGLIIVWYT